MRKVSECCGSAVDTAKRRGKTYLVCSKCHNTTNLQKRIVIRGTWRNPYTG